ncbi:MAG: PadR family transcriptional regulator [bacterium]
MNISKELLKGTTKIMVLSVIGDNELYGYQIIKLLKERSANVLKMGEGTIYPILHFLESEKYLSSRWEKMDNGMKRKYYSLTERGKKLLKESLNEWKDFTNVVNTTLFNS